MTKSKWMLLTGGLAVMLLLAGCGGNDDAANNNAGGDNGGNTTTASAEDIYKANCISCHGADLKGQKLSTVGSRKSRDEIETKIREGGGGMIAFEGRLEDAEIDALADWLAEKK